MKLRDLKINYGFGGHCNLCTLSGFCLFCNCNSMKLPFPDVFDELLFLYASPFSPKSFSSYEQTSTHHVGVLNLPNQVSSKWIPNSGQNWREMQICDYQIYQKTTCITLRPFQMSNQIAQFNSSKLICG